MPFKKEFQNFSSSINELTIGLPPYEIILGGENILPFYTFDLPDESGTPDKHRPKVGIAISDSGLCKDLPKYNSFYDGATTVADVASRAAKIPGVDFLVICLDNAHPDKENTSPEDCAALVKEISNSINIPIAVMGCDHIEKDAKIFEKVASALFGKNILVLSAREENHKNVAAAAGLAYPQKVGAESSVDINLAKQLNILITQIGVKPENMAMDIGSAAAGYGFEYIISTIDRVKLAALSQDDSMLQMPIITPVFSQTWTVKESTASPDDYPEWGSVESRGIYMEITTAAACLAAGSNAVILMHPDSVETISLLIKELM